jgi:hypothetical protein
MIFNELEYAEQMLKKGFLEDKYLFELKILAKYYNKIKELKTQDIKIKLKDFCEKFLPEYNEVLHLEMIAKAVHYGVQKKNILVVIPPIPIMKNELMKIKSLNNLELEKLAFTGLVLGKINKYTPKKKKNKKSVEDKGKGYYINNFKDLFKYSKVKERKDKKDLFLNQLHDSELFTLTIFSSFKINFIEEDSEVEFVIKKFDDFVLEYLRYIGVAICCENCGKIIIPTNNRQVYCKSCWKEHRNDYQKKLMRKIRNN